MVGFERESAADRVGRKSATYRSAFRRASRAAKGAGVVAGASGGRIPPLRLIVVDLGLAVCLVLVVDVDFLFPLPWFWPVDFP